ncbi:hypothetical protein [Haloechinothrix salitolerans]|uniref:Integral membrane protein n=1 Tax=Haloechinothrix salitolerans TaxID=926830 RepID=A0ABW2BX92_9PSEU
MAQAPATPDVDSGADAHPSERRGARCDLLAAVLAVGLIAIATAVGAYLNRARPDVVLWAPAAPLYGRWEPRFGLAVLFAALLAVAVIAWGPGLAERLRWRPALALTYVGAVGWTLSLALIDGWQRGLAERLDNRWEYLDEVPGVTDISAMLTGFTDRILLGEPDTWATHVAGHPPGALLVFVWLDRVGLSGGGIAALACVLVGGLAAVAVPVALHTLGAPDAARRMLPFAALFPGAIWIGASADGLFAGYMACAVAVLAFAATSKGPSRHVLALLAGVMLGFGVFLSYGFVLFGPLALAVVAYRRAWEVLPVAVVGALAVVAVFALAGFWWLDGYTTVVERYYQNLGAKRPFEYWVWANLAALAIMIGFAVVAGIRRAVADLLRRRWSAVVLVVGAALVAIIAADVSGLSKAETERIWLPFAVWLLPAAALLPRRLHPAWLTAQASVAVAVSLLVATPW